MKLRSEMRDNGRDSGKHLVAEGDWYYDAAAAQAYKQALEEYESAEDGQANIIAALIKRRASAIFSEWGFDSGEVVGDENQ